MTNSIQHLEDKIGFSTIRNMIIDGCSNQRAIRFAEQMCFSNNYENVVCELQQTEEFRQILMMENNFPSQDFFDLSTELSRLKTIGTYIDLQSLFDLKCSLRTVFDCYNFFTEEKEEKYPELNILSKKIELDPWILKECNRIVDDRGEIYDNASETLNEIRRQKRHKTFEIDRQINKTLSHAKQEGWAPENAEITIRDGRAVIPMLDTHRRKIKGIIIDESATRQTAYLEPAEVVELNNDLRELDFQEHREIENILKNFSNNIREILPQLLTAYWVIGKFDFIRAKARFAIDIHAGLPIVDNKPKIYWFDARHPLLYINLTKQHKEVVPFNIELNNEQRIVIISGPNSGGKSVCLKAIGLLQYMLQSGLLVPVKETSEFGIFDNLFIDIGDQQSIENDLSTYSSHLTNMKQLLSTANTNTLFLLDEFDSYLHPTWQREFVKLINNTDIRGQIIFTTHSPASISKVQRENVFIMKNGEVFQPLSDTFNRSLEEIMEEQMEISLRPPEYTELVQEFRNAIMHNNRNLALAKLDQIKEVVGENDPFFITARIALERMES